MSIIAVFEFDDSEIRFVDDKPVANDVAAVLGYADPAATIAKKVKDKNKSVAKITTSDGKSRDVAVLKEAGVYQLIFKSKLPIAEKFQDWLFKEILPELKSKWQSFDFESQSSQMDNTGFVYLALSSQTKHCKIGMSKKPYKRMTSLQTGNPLEVILVHRIFTLDMVALEKALHDYYQGYWMRGEWFDLPLECIKEFPIVANELDTELEKTCLPESKIVSSIN